MRYLLYVMYHGHHNWEWYDNKTYPYITKRKYDFVIRDVMICEYN